MLCMYLSTDCREVPDCVGHASTLPVPDSNGCLYSPQMSRVLVYKVIHVWYELYIHVLYELFYMKRKG